jgi:flagellar motor switch protein FliN/FliY
VVAHLLEVPLTASVVLAEKTLPLKDVLALRVGQVLEFSRRVDEPLPLRAGDRPLADGSAVKLGDRFGLEVTAAPAARDAVAALGP